MLSNEDLAVRIRAGEKELLAVLWEQTKGFIFGQMLKLYHGNQTKALAAGVTPDDVRQQGYFALLDTVQAFDPARNASLLTYSCYHVRNHFANLVGMRTSKQQNEPLNNSNSLDDVISSNDGEYTLLDTLADPEAAQAFASAEDSVYREQLHRDLQACLDMIPDKQAETLQGIYFEGKTLTAISQSKGVAVESVRVLHNQGLRNMRHGSRLQILKHYRANIISTHGYKGGLSAFRSWRGSSVERTAEFLD